MARQTRRPPRSSERTPLWVALRRPRRRGSKTTSGLLLRGITPEHDSLQIHATVRLSDRRFVGAEIKRSAPDGRVLLHQIIYGGELEKVKHLLRELEGTLRGGTTAVAGSAPQRWANRFVTCLGGHIAERSCDRTKP